MSTSASSKDPVRFAYVGAGFIAQSVHIPNFLSLPECRFLALAEVRPELGQSVASRYRIPKVYPSHHEIAEDPEIEAVGVSGPYALQGKVAEDLLRAGKNVFMEKPMAVSVRRAEEIIQAEKEGGGRLMVAYMKRYDPGNVLLKQHLEEWRANGKHGRLLFARNHGFGGDWLYAQDPTIPFSTSNAPSPAAPNDCPDWLPEKFYDKYLGYLQQWTHNFNLLRFFLGDTGGKTQVSHVDLDADGLTGVVTLSVNGTRAIVESTYTKYHGWDEHTQIYFEGGYLKTEAPCLMDKAHPASVEIYRAASDGRPPELTRQFAVPAWSYREEARHFLGAVRSGEPFHSSGADTVNDVRLLEEIYRKFIGA